MLSASLILSLHCCWAWLPSSSFLSSDLNHSIAFDLKTLRSEEWGLPSHCLFFFFLLLPCYVLILAFCTAEWVLCWTVAGCFTRSRLGFYGFFFFGYRWCNRICFMFFVDGSWQVFFFFFLVIGVIWFFIFFLMFFMGGSWQASSWLGWACFC